MTPPLEMPANMENASVSSTALQHKPQTIKDWLGGIDKTNRPYGINAHRQDDAEEQLNKKINIPW